MDKGTEIGAQRTLESPDDEGGGGRYNGDLGLTVLDGELYGDAQTLPSGGRFCDIFSDLLRGLEREKERKKNETPACPE